MSGLPLPWVFAGVGIGYLFYQGILTFRGVFGVAGVLVAGVAVLLYKFQENLLYQPRIFPQHLRPQDNPAGMRHPGEHGLAWDDVRLTASDGCKLHAWLIRPEDSAERKSRPTVMFFHENAGNMGLRLEGMKLLYDRLRVNIFLLSYRGYGESEGRANEDGMYLDSEAAFQYVRSRSDLDSSRIVLMGRSLGGAVAIDLASRHEADGEGEGVACIIVENTFASIADMVDVIFPWLAWAKRFVLWMKWESRRKIATITRPILFLSGAQDEIVPASQMVTLHAAATASSHKELVVFPTGRHNDTWREGGEEYLQRIRAFLEKYAVGKQPPTQRAAL